MKTSVNGPGATRDQAADLCVQGPVGEKQEGTLPGSTMTPSQALSHAGHSSLEGFPETGSCHTPVNLSQTGTFQSRLQ